MDFNLPLPSFFFSTLTILVSTQLPWPSHAHDTANYYETCKETIYCGSIGTVEYPFYTENRPKYCGHPGFNLSCTGIPTITIMSQEYYVISINDTTNTLVVARTDYWGHVCPASLVNITIDFTLFSYTSADENITLYYGCTSSLSGLQKSCGTSTDGEYFLTRSMEDSDSYQQQLASCSGKLFVPVHQSDVAAIDDSEGSAGTVTSALKNGFELEWLPENNKCGECEDGGGQCGFDWDLGDFTCYCSTENPNCNNTGSKSKTGLLIGIAAGATCMLVLLLGCGFLLLTRRRKQLHISHSEGYQLAATPSSGGLPSSNGFTTTAATTTATTTNLSQSISSYSTSKSEVANRRSTYFGVQVFSYTELEAATNNFDESRELGDGGFGTVYYGELPDGRIIAVKRLHEKNYKRVEQFVNEVEILARLRHKNLVTLYGCTSKRSPKLLLVYEYIPNGTVADHLHRKRPEIGLLTWATRLNIAIETADALSYLHASDVIHRDVKTANILLDNNFQVKVADFGLSRLFPNDATHVSTAPQGTPGYLDPEYFQLYQLTEKSDVYSFGVVLFELISSKEAVDVTRHKLDVNLANMAINRIRNEALHELVDPCLGFENDYDVQEMIKSVAELACQCLHNDKDIRPTMSEVFEILKGIREKSSE
ncbi:hypothetical protein Nepgr_020862 [Nepenthes gracilis]|uniref:non-specific serine/threonine protein kinase n=1 Tax=Nepenthes gracilis TaxID=150966 RepID=A0AAD3XWS9_NEPGR|nr:hypothetical protein Nepgr_020862 [Nepenthes gracilis]